MIRPDLTLVTYTHNDHALTHGLLAEISGWSVRPGQVIVVDDGSQPPFVLEGNTENIEILRLEPNRGPAGAKQTGISLASAAPHTGLILSLDNDIRPHPAWLESALPLVQDPTTGLVGANIVWQSGTDATSRYLSRFCNYRAQEDTLLFLAGGIWLLRRDVWDRLGGFADYPSRTHEDYHFSRLVVAAGLRLRLCDAHPVRETRRLGRVALVRRMQHYLAASVLPVMHRQRFSAVLPLLAGKAQNVRDAADSGEPDLIYIELLLTSAYFFHLFAHGVRLLDEAENDASGLMSALARLLRPYPVLTDSFVADMADIGHTMDFLTPSLRPNIWDQVLQTLIPPQIRPVLAWLDRVGLARLKKQEAEQNPDYHYLSAT